MNCGTLKGYDQHKAANTPACEYCKSAKAKHDAGTTKVAPIRSKRELKQCGTTAAYNRHRRNGTTGYFRRTSRHRGTFLPMTLDYGIQIHANDLEISPAHIEVQYTIGATP